MLSRRNWFNNLSFLTEKDFIANIPLITKSLLTGIILFHDKREQCFEFIRGLPLPRQAKIVDFINSIALEPYLVSYIISNLPEAGRRPVFDSITNEQKNSITNLMLNSNSYALSGFKLQWQAYNFASANQLELSAILGLNLDPELINVLALSYKQSFQKDIKYQMRFNVVNYKGLVAFNNLLITTKFSSLINPAKSKYFGKLSPELISYIGSFIIGSDVQAIKDKQLLALEAEQKLETENYKILPTENSLAKPKLSILSRLNFTAKKFVALIDSEHVFCAMLALYASSLLILFNVAHYIWVPVLMFFVSVFAHWADNNINYVKNLWNYLVSYRVPNYGILSVCLLAASATWALIYYNLAYLSFIPVSIVLLLFAQSLLAESCKFDIKNHTAIKSAATLSGKDSIMVAAISTVAFSDIENNPKITL